MLPTAACMAASSTTAPDPSERRGHQGRLFQPVLVALLLQRCCFIKDPMVDPEPITPMTALTLDANGRLSYMAEDGSRRVIVADPDLFDRLQQLSLNPDQD